MKMNTVYPRSVHEKYLGVVQLARTIDKATMMATGSLGEYNYDCPMDKALFLEFGIDGKKLFHIAKYGADGDIEGYVKPLIAKKNEIDINRFNLATLTQKPTGDSLKHFEDLRAQIAPTRTDVTSWPDLLDLDEGRTVSKRETGKV
jgi:Domain of unknown function (DUF5069)